MALDLSMFPTVSRYSLRGCSFSIYYRPHTPYYIAFNNKIMDKLSEKARSLSPPRPPQVHSPPVTPRKQPRYPNEEARSGRRVKSITKMVEKESASLLYSVLLIAWALGAISVVVLALQAKLAAGQEQAAQEVRQCSTDFENNR